MTDYYIYAYLREDGTPYYIGKGKGRRAFLSHRKHGITTPSDKSRIFFMETGLTNVGACALERRYIRWFGKKCNETGILRNKTDGGEGNTAPRTPEWRANHSAKLKGRILGPSQLEKHRKAIAGRNNSYMKTEAYSKSISNGKSKKRCFVES